MNTKRKYKKSIRRKYKKSIGRKSIRRKYKKSIKRKSKYTKKNKKFFLQKGGIGHEVITAARELIDRIDNFFKDCNIGIECYLIPEPGSDHRNYHRKIYLYINNSEDNSKEYFYQTTFKIIDYDFEDEQSVENWSTLDKKMLHEEPRENKNYELYITTTLCILNGYSFAIIVQGYIMCKCLLEGIIFAKKEDMTDAASKNLPRNFNNILGFFTGEHIHLVHSEDNEDLTNYITKRGDEEKSKWDKVERDRPLLAAAKIEDEDDDEDYNSSQSDSQPFSDDSQDNYVIEEEEFSMPTTEPTKYALLPKVIPQLNNYLNEHFFTEKERKFHTFAGKRKQHELQNYLDEKVITISQNRQKLEEQSTGWTFDNPRSSWHIISSENLFTPTI